MGDDQDPPFRPGKDFPVAGGVASYRPGPTLASTGCFDRRLVRRRPLAVVDERPAFEAAEADVVQFGHHDARDDAPREREVGRLSHALELARHAQVEFDAGEPFAEPQRLLLAGCGQRAGDGRVAVDGADEAELALTVAGEDHLVHLACLRSSADSSRRMKRMK